MSEEQAAPRPRPPFSARLSRRELFRYAGTSVGAVSLASLLSSCTKAAAKGGFHGEPDGVLNFASWPLYIDKERNAGGVRYSPSLKRFREETGIQVNYREVVTDSETFFQKIEPWLVAGEPTGWDVIVITNGGALTKMMELDYLVELPNDLRPNFDEHAADFAKHPAYDDGARHTMAWQSGITGIAYNPQMTGRQITSLQDLFSPEFKGKVGMFGDFSDVPNLVLLAVGAEPESSTPEDWQTAADLLVRQRQDGIIKANYQQNYVNALTNGDVALSMAYSGDIYQLNATGEASGLRFVVPEEGALIWTDNMCIPKGVQHPADAITYMDYVYKPEIAAMIAQWVNYITPVPGAKARIEEMAATAGDTAEQARLEAIVGSPLVFPTPEDTTRLHTYRELTPEEDVQWRDIFGPAVGA